MGPMGPQGLPGAAGARAWAFTAGQDIPSWLTLAQTGTIATASPPSSATVTKDYVVEVYGTAQGSSAKAYGKVTVNLLAFNTSLFGDAGNPDGSQVDLLTFARDTANLNVNAGWTWSFANPVGTPLPGYMNLSPAGMLQVPQYSQVRGEVLVKAVSGTNTVLGKVMVNALWLGPGATLAAPVGAAGGTSVNAKALPNMVLNGTDATRTWAWTSGQQIPPWVTLDSPSGQLVLTPARHGAALPGSENAETCARGNPSSCASAACRKAYPNVPRLLAPPWK
jgi:hypothetical protein